MAKKPAKAHKANKAVHKNALSDIISSVNKAHGDGTIIYGEQGVVAVEVIPTNIASLDAALGVGGLPRGRMIEIFGLESCGKTTTALQFALSCQETYFPSKERNGVVAYIDAEHALDRTWAENMGINFDEMLISQPESGEQALDVAQKLAESGAIDLIVVDSIAGLIPQEELDAGILDIQMGAQARMMSKALRKLKTPMHTSGVVIVFINQVRQKVGVMFGCFHGDTLVSFADGRRIPISDVVTQRLRGPVLSYNEVTGTIEPTEITNWFANGEVDYSGGERWLQFITTGAGSANGRMGFACTSGHILYRPDGTEVIANEVSQGEQLMSYCEHKILLDDIHRSIIFGSILGDGCLRLRNTDTACLSLANTEQPEYARWKINNLPMLRFKQINSCGRERFDSQYSTELKLLHARFYPSGRGYRTIPANITIDDLCVAVLYMDNGCLKDDKYRLTPVPIISFKRLRNNHDSMEQARLLLSTWLGADINGITIQPSDGIIAIAASYASVFFERIAKYVPPSMQYKLPPQYRDRNIQLKPTTPTAMLLPYPVTVLKVEIGSNRRHRSLMKYDIEVAGKGTYLVGGGRGIVVHNSPETTPGGLALKFWSSIRIDLRKGVPIQLGKTKDDGDGSKMTPKANSIGHQTKAKIIKNKVAPPFKECVYDIYFGLPAAEGQAPVYGIDTIGSLLDAAIGYEIIEIAGGQYSYKGERLGCGRYAAAAALRDQPETQELIRQNIMEIVAPKAHMKDQSPEELAEIDETQPL